MSKAIRLFLDMQGIDLLEGDVWGHRKDIEEYYMVEEYAIEQIGDIISGGESIDDAVSHVQMTTRLSPDLNFIEYPAAELRGAPPKLDFTERIPDSRMVRLFQPY